MASNDYIFNIELFGSGYVGKSNLISRFTRNEFNLESKSIIDAECSTKSIQIDGKTIRTLIWEKEPDVKIKFPYTGNPTGAMLVYSISNSRSYDDIKKLWKNELRDSADRYVAILVGTKVDEELDLLRQVDFKTAELFAQKNNMNFMETSAQTAFHVEEAFHTLIDKMYKITTRRSLSQRTRLALGRLCGAADESSVSNESSSVPNERSSAPNDSSVPNERNSAPNESSSAANESSSAANERSSAANENESSVATTAKSLCFVYNGATGTAENLAGWAARAASASGFRLSAVAPFQEFDPRLLLQQTLTVFFCDTTMQDSKPENKCPFWRYLELLAMKNLSLSEPHFVVVRIGASSVATNLDLLLRKVSAVQVPKMLQVHDHGRGVDLEEWLKDVFSKLTASSNFGPSFKISLPGEGNDGGNELSSFDALNPLPAVVTRNEQITPIDPSQDTRLIEFSLGVLPPPSYSEGDICLVRPANLRENVERFLKLFPELHKDMVVKVEEATAPVTKYELSLLSECRTFEDLATRYWDVAVMEKFSPSTFRVPIALLSDIFHFFPTLKPRDFSIVGESKGKVQIHVDVGGQELCSNFLARCDVGTCVRIWLEKGSSAVDKEEDVTEEEDVAKGMPH